MVWGKQGHVTCKVLLLKKASFCVSVEFCGHHDTNKYEENLAALGFADMTRFTMIPFCISTHFAVTIAVYNYN